LLEQGHALLPAPEPRALRLEFYGDSITAGACNADPVQDQDQHDDMSMHDGTRAYGALAARQLGADYVGIALSGSGIAASWNGVLLPDVFDRVAPRHDAALAEVGPRTPDAVLINLGQNDFSFPQEQGAPFPIDFGARYVAFVRQLRIRYPNAYIVALLGGMTGWRESPELRQGFADAVRVLQQDDPRIASYIFQNDSPLHPRLDVHALMASELVAFLRTLSGLLPGLNATRWRRRHCAPNTTCKRLSVSA